MRHIYSYLPDADEFTYWFPPNLVKQSSRTRTMGPHFFSEIRRFILSSIFSFRGSAFRSIFPCPPNPTSPKTAMYPREQLLCILEVGKLLNPLYAGPLKD